MDTPDECCGICQYWKRHTIDGMCRRYPVMVLSQRRDWCGEWKLDKRLIELRAPDKDED